MIRSSERIKELESQVASLKSAVEELRVLNEIAITSGKASDIDQMLNIIVQKAISAINAEQGSILLVTKNEEDPFKTIIRQDDSSKLSHNYRVGTNITGWVLLNKEPLIIENLSTDKRFIASEEEKKEIHSVLSVPIWFEGDIIGIMMMINKKRQKSFSQSDLTLFSIISVQAGQLIKNLQLQKESFEKRKEAEKLQELDRIKTNFFTNISHEFRTPLTLILGPLEKLMNDRNKDKDVLSSYRLMQNNANKLLSLINQLLDLSSIDAGKINLEVEENDLIRFVKGITASFQPLAENKNIKLEFNSRQEKFKTYFDKGKIEKIINNLISNALKFTPENGNIVVSIDLPEEDLIEIIIKDSGIGIHPEKLEFIFNRFYKIENNTEVEGTGIGLALVKELVELHKGTVNVESELNKGTKFIINLTAGKEVYKDFIIKKKETETKKFETGDKHQKIKSEKQYSENKKPGEHPIILVVEDNEDIRHYISENISSSYSVIESSNGKEGLEKSYSTIPDLIISDIKMPEMDGIELCQKIKTDERTSHIPVILLTARSTIENKIEGLETGADEYITKPFNISELQVRINNLIEQRKKLRERFRKEILLEPKEIEVTSADERFLKRIREILEEHISNENFTVDEFSKEAGLSRMQLHRKLQALTDQSASEFIRNYRLKRAAKLLTAKKGNISEIAYDVGFSNPSYFAECFKSLFGLSPSEYLHNHSPRK